MDVVMLNGSVYSLVALAEGDASVNKWFESRRRLVQRVGFERGGDLRTTAAATDGVVAAKYVVK